MLSLVPGTVTLCIAGSEHILRAFTLITGLPFNLFALQVLSWRVRVTLLTTQGWLMRLNAILCLKAVGELQSSVRIVFLLCISIGIHRTTGLV